MERRKFLGLGLGLGVAVAMTPATLSAVDFRKEKPGAFSGPNATSIDAAMKEIFGTSSTTEADVKLKAPAIAENGAVVPLAITSKLAGSTVAIFQDANPESLVSVYTVPANGLIDYKLRIKMAKTGKVVAVVQADGKLYSATTKVKVTAGGCGG
jgi:sulfur-oxidizing protein SoxY